MKYLYTIIFFLLIPLFTVQAQAVRGPFQKLSLDEGLALHRTFDFMQDREGYLWFGTLHGLVRFDGRDYRLFRHDPDNRQTLSHDDIIALHQDPHGNIWIGTWGGGLNVLNPVTGQVKRINQPRYPGLTQSATFWAISSTTRQDTLDLWLAAADKGLLQISVRCPDADSLQLLAAQNHKTTLAENHAVDYVNHVTTDIYGRIWLATNRGAFFRHETSASGTDFQPAVSRQADKMPPPTAVSKFYHSNTGTLWLTGRSGELFYIDSMDAADGVISGGLQIDQFPQRRQNHIHSLLEDQKGNLWLGTGGGVLIRQRGSTSFLPLSGAGNPSEKITNHLAQLMLQDRSGVIWMSFYGRGLYRQMPLELELEQLTVPHTEDEAENSVQTILATGDGSLWAGDKAGLWQYETGNAQPLLHRQLPAKYVSALSASQDGQGRRVLWIGTQFGGLYQYWPHNGKFRHFAASQTDEKSLWYNQISALCNAGDSLLWIGSPSGICQLDLTTGQIKRLPWMRGNEQAQWALTFFPDSDGALWIGSYNGLTKVSPDRRKLQHFRHHPDDPHSLSNNYVYCIVRDSNNRLVIGTSNGLNFLDESDSSFHTLYEKDGLANNVICALQETDDKKLWISTQKGLSVYDGQRFVNYDKKSGLPGNLFIPHAAAMDDNGHLYFGSFSGICKIRSLARPVIYQPQAASITSVRYDAREYSPQVAPETFPYRHGLLEFRFALFDFHNPANHRYRVKLAGLDTAFYSLGTVNQVTYRSLPPGNYTLRVRATNQAGMEATAETTFDFTVAAPFWQTAWFITLCFVVGCGSILLFHRLRIRRKVRESLLVERARLHERDLVREKTARDYHDELGHQITKISLYGELLRREINAESYVAEPVSYSAAGNRHAATVDVKTSSVVHYLRKITTASEALCQNARDFIWALHPEKDSLEEVYRRLAEFGHDLLEESEIVFTAAPEPEHLSAVHLIMDVRRHLVLIFKEAMNNALRHSEAENVLLKVHVSDREVTLVLEDDGNGFSADGISESGLQNMKKRSRQIGGSLQIDSSPDGTAIALSLRLPGKTPTTAKNGIQP